MTKQCSKCKEHLEILNFGSNGRNGVHSWCKLCAKKDAQRYQRTKDGVTSSIYNSQKFHSKTRGHNAPTYSLMELRDWLYSQKSFHRQYDMWKESNYDRWCKPSVDRIDDSIGYSLGNIQLISWEQNREKQAVDFLSAKLTNNHKPVSIYENGELIGTFESYAIAGRTLGIANRNIYRTIDTGVQSGKYTYYSKEL